MSEENNQSQAAANTAPTNIVNLPETPKVEKPCRAKDVGHRSCDCGRPGCGELATRRH